ncbi:hypothetical protein LUZ61_004963 [Rhynchospora tenuis]|uniref:HNH nuclease domain-containing protein n=1 Tax=Rhynchospora tenuis TaxID=198213 RepID=A0AAD5ZNT3_9POAL|nr:hypothetical protein LUZ61_004963 [Rhynchospora tenuis]
MGTRMAFTEEERGIDETLGYPKAYTKLCKSPNLLGPYSHGPPFTFIPYMLQPQEALKIKEVNEMFPVIDPEAVPSVNPRGFVNLLWKQLDHLGNAGFDPALFRVDPYGNVLYLHADKASPLSWEIDHWFPCARGGKTVPSNLRIVQSHVCKKKGHKLEFLIPWWDLQIGISVNQFLSIFASKGSDYRKRAFSFLFAEGGNEELNAVQSVEAHAFPQHFNEAGKKSGLAPAAIVSTRSSDVSVLKPVDINRSTRPTYPMIAAMKFQHKKDNGSLDPNISKENSNPNVDSDFSVNPHFSIAMARDSLRRRDEARKKQLAEMEEIDGEVEKLKERNEEERVEIQGLEELLIKKKRRAEKCRHLAEAQAQYKSMLEKMIRDAMHQSVVYKEQLRLNQAAANALMARLEAQRSICDSSENELRRKFKQRDEMETQIKQFCDKSRKRSRVENHDAAFSEGRQDLRSRFSSRRHGRKPLTKELRVFLEEEQRASETGDEKLSLNKNRVRRFSLVERGSTSVNEKLETLSIRDFNDIKGKGPLVREPPYKLDMEKLRRHTIDSISKNEIDEEEEENEEHMNEIGRGNVDKWLQMLIDNSQEDPMTDDITAPSDEITEVEKAYSDSDSKKTKVNAARKSFHVREIEERKVVDLPRTESTRAFRSLPSSPSSVILGMKKGVDCIGRKPKVVGEDEEYGYLDSNSVNNGKFVKAIKKALIK